jgi:galactose mutarotase-like enzyme
LGDIVAIAGPALRAEVNPLGAELWSLRDPAGRDLLWNGDPAYWTGRAPILFPFVGTLNGDRYKLDGRDYTLARHGFARRSRFDVVEISGQAARFRLLDTDATRAVYPFGFQLDVVFGIEGAALSIAAELTNTGDAPLPAGFGFHPAFRWPLPENRDKAEHVIEFAEEETAPLRRLDGEGLLTPDLHPSPIRGRRLELRDDLFEADALIFTEPVSRSVTYSASAGPRLRLDFSDTPHLGIWSKPGAPFVCIEPWQGHSDPTGFDGEIWDKPGMLHVPAGEVRTWRMRVELLA